MTISRPSHARHAAVTAVVCCFAITLTTGCKQGPWGKLRWGGGPEGQGTIEQQKDRAVTEIDPYPMQDIGPEVVGGRPRGFMDPLAEPVRNEMDAYPPRTWSRYPMP